MCSLVFQAAFLADTNNSSILLFAESLSGILLKTSGQPWMAGRWIIIILPNLVLDK